MSTTRTWALVAVLSACGGTRVADHDASVPNDAAGDGAVRDAADEDAGPGSALMRCTTVFDCLSNEFSCEEGLCCNGHMDAGVCLCGSAPGCDMFSTCCATFGYAEDAGCAPSVKKCPGYFGP